MSPNNQTVEERLDELTARADDLEEELRGAIGHIIEFLREQERLVRQGQQVEKRRHSALARAQDKLGELLE